GGWPAAGRAAGSSAGGGPGGPPRASPVSPRPAPGRGGGPGPAEGGRAAVTAQLVRIFGPDAARPADYLDHDWTREEWSGGGYVGVMAPGTMTRVGGGLRAPGGRLPFAGTETAARGVGYFDGASQAGGGAGPPGGLGPPPARAPP